MPPKRLKPWMIVSAAWIIPALFGGIGQVAHAQINGWGPVTARGLLFASGDWFLYAFLTPAVFLLSERWPLVRARFWRGAAVHFIFALLFCVVWATLGRALGNVLGLLLAPHELYQDAARAGNEWRVVAMREWIGWVFTTFPFGVAVYLCMVAAEHATRYYIETNERGLQLARVSAQLSDARLSSLQAQVNPHFLFNSLNTINVFVRDGDTGTATHIIDEFSALLRLTLDRSRDVEITLDEELEVVRRYLAVERARFSDRLQPLFDIGAGLASAAVPAFSVQHLVENAIRHGIARRTNSGLVSVQARRAGDFLEVQVNDNGAGGAPDLIPAPGHGIMNTRERIATLYGDRASLEMTLSAEGAIALLRVPYREVPHASDKRNGE